MMGTTIDKLNKVKETKAAIRKAIANKGVEVPEDTIFADYPNKISEITSGEGGGDSTTYENPNFYEIRTNGGTDCSYLFYNYNGTSLDLSNWDMTNVSNTDLMFGGCRRLHTLRLDNCNEDTIRKIIESDEFPTGKTFGGTRKIYCLEENVANLVPPTSWEFVDAVTGEVIVLEEPEFYSPGYYKGRDIEEATTMVTSEHDNLSEMFQGCENLRTINNISEWDTSNVTNMDNMFKSCNSLVSLDLSKWVVSKVKSMSDMIQGCKSLVSVNASNWDVSNVTNMWGMFADCRNLQELDLSGWDMTNVSKTTYMFNNSSNLRTLRLDNCNEETIRKIITVDSFPTGDIGVLRQIFVKVDVSDLTEPLGWVFSPLAEGDEE
jgi:surface protein